LIFGSRIAPRIGGLRPSTSLLGNDQRGSYWGYFGRAFGKVARRFVTHRDTMWPSIAALQKVWKK